MFSDDIGTLLAVLPPQLESMVRDLPNFENIVEIVLDLGRFPGVRFNGHEIPLNDHEVTSEDIKYAIARVGAFGDDNRAGIERTLHRISALRNRSGAIIGLTLRVGRAVYGTVAIIQDLLASGESILLLGRPGTGKTTLLREAARVLAEEIQLRVIVVDTSNEIAGDGDVPHNGIGRARRMQVPGTLQQHQVMIEAVENHMPQVVVIDEIGTASEAAAARTIAERGVQLIATAHGQSLEGLMRNPTLVDLVGGIQSVTLSDEQARYRGTQKAVLERTHPPTFTIIVEIQDREHITVHLNAAAAVDALLRGQTYPVQLRTREESIEQDADNVTITQQTSGSNGKLHESFVAHSSPGGSGKARTMRIYSYGLTWGRVEQAAKEAGIIPLRARALEDAEVVIAHKNSARERSSPLTQAKSQAIPWVLSKSSSVAQIAVALSNVRELLPIPIAPPPHSDSNGNGNGSSNGNGHFVSSNGFNANGSLGDPRKKRGVRSYPKARR